MAKPIIYVAGPYTKPDPAINVANAMMVGHWLMSNGAYAIVPHLSHFMHIQQSRPYREWLDQDKAILARCDGLYLIPGESPGADEEVELCHNLDLPVFTNDDEFRDWLRHVWRH
jgi:hypothetical protein